eukprot:1393076-Amorphochlora_amoeboformis.AAC.1
MSPFTSSPSFSGIAIRMLSPSGIAILFPLESVSVTSSTFDTRLSPPWLLAMGASTGSPGSHETMRSRASE